MNDRSRGIAVALVAAGVSGVAVFVNGLGVRRFDDATVYTTGKNLVAAVVLVAVLGALDARRPSTPTAPTADFSARTVRWLGLIAVVGGSVPFVLFFEGFARATSNDAAFIHKTLVVWVALAATSVLRERLTILHAAAIAVLLAGQAVLAGGVDDLAVGSGEALILAATLLWSAEVVIAKRVLAEVPSQVAATARMGGGCLILLGWLAATGRLGELATIDANQGWWLALTGSTLAVFVSVWYRALALAGAIDVTAVLVLGAVITGVLNVIFRGAPITGASSGWVLITAAVIAVATGAVVGRAGARPEPVAV